MNLKTNQDYSENKLDKTKKSSQDKLSTMRGTTYFIQQAKVVKWCLPSENIIDCVEVRINLVTRVPNVAKRIVLTEKYRLPLE